MSAWVFVRPPYKKRGVMDKITRITIKGDGWWISWFWKIRMKVNSEDAWNPVPF